MDKRKLLLMGATLAGLGALTSTPAHAVTSVLTINAVIVEAIALDCTGTPLNFGDLEGTVADTITVTAAGVRSEGAGADNLVTNAGNLPTAGVCTLDGADGLAINIGIPDTTVTGPGLAMAVNNYTLAGPTVIAGGPNNFTTTLGISAVPVNYTVGGDLVVAASQAVGSYTGTTTVTVAYQ